MLAGAVLAAAAIAGCGAARVPENESGVRTLYRGVAIDVGVGDPQDICRSYLTPPLRREVERLPYGCAGTRVERWAEKVRLSGIKRGTRIVVSGATAVVYDGEPPEHAVYVSGRWLLSGVPELTEAPARKRPDPGTSTRDRSR